MEKYKKCATCDKELPMNTFYYRVDNNMKDGFKKHCKECISKGKIKIPLNEGEYVCKICGRSLPYTLQYFKPKGKNHRLTSPCRECYGEKFLTIKPIIKEGYRLCSKCKTSKPFEEFYKSKSNVSGYSGQCKECHKEYNSNNLEKRNLYTKEHKIKHPHIKIKYSIRGRIRNALQNKLKRDSTIALLGCSMNEYKKYLDNLMSEQMNWENYGKIWQIDHVIPCSKFNLLLKEEQLKCFNYKNTQPMFSHDNNSKLNRNSLKVIYKTSKFFKNNFMNNTKYIKIDDR